MRFFIAGVAFFVSVALWFPLLPNPIHRYALSVVVGTIGIWLAWRRGRSSGPSSGGGNRGEH
jgi:hypothetical protein